MESGEDTEGMRADLQKQIQNELRKLSGMKLDLGLSDTEESLNIRSHASRVLFAKKAPRPPPPPTHRDGMGAYKAPPGGRYLSDKDANPGPAANEYTPNVKAVKTSFPEWTLGIRFEKRAREKSDTPSPGKYNCQGDLGKGAGPKILSRKFPKEKGECSGGAGAGPAAVMLSREISTGPKYTMRVKPKTNKNMPGLTSRLTTDLPPGNPGPNYRPPDDEWLQKPQTIGSKYKSKVTESPGPKYPPTGYSRGPQWHMGLARKSKQSKAKSPAPNAYMKPSTVGEGPRQTIARKYYPSKYQFSTPGPDQYDRAGFNLQEPGVTMKYRWFDSNTEVSRPGPLDYSPKVSVVKVRHPAFTMAERNIQKEATQSGPSPAHYDVRPKPSNAKGPTIGNAGAKLSKEPNETPSPADYTRGHNLRMPNAPAFTMGHRDNRTPASVGYPGPGAYTVPDPPSKPGKTMGKRLTSKGDTSQLAGPASYETRGGCPPCQTATGATLKSRHTPLKYSGLKDTSVVGPPMSGCSVPLLG